jgi:hypothetical protein
MSILEQKALDFSGDYDDNGLDCFQVQGGKLARDGLEVLVDRYPADLEAV